MTRVMGLDLSLSATGIAIDGDDCGVVKVKTFGMERLIAIRDRVLDEASRHDVVIVEGYAMGTGRQKQTYGIGELGGVIRLALFELPIPYAEVPPASLKTFATGKGNAPKDAMLAAAIRKFEFPGEDNNEADAWLLRELGKLRYDGPPSGRDHTQVELKAMNGVEWPSLVVPA